MQLLRAACSQGGGELRRLGDELECRVRDHGMRFDHSRRNREQTHRGSYDA